MQLILGAPQVNWKCACVRKRLGESACADKRRGECACAPKRLRVYELNFEEGKYFVYLKDGKINLNMIECRHKLYDRLYEGVGQINQWIEKGIFEKKCG